jgi:phospholipid-binding lipoprotein MlaA
MLRCALVLVLALAALLHTPSAIASDEGSDGAAEAAPGPADDTPDYDPWHALNERTFWFNYYVLDKHVMKPIAHVWQRVLPYRVRQGIGNFFDNLSMPKRLVNDLLQTRPRAAGTQIARFAINTTVGAVGFVDIAERLGFHGSDADGGQTLGVWGVGPGPYLVLPFLPPLTLRDGIGYGADTTADPVGYVVPVPLVVSIATTSVRRVNERALQPAAFEDLEETVLDLYSAVRNLYLQRRRLDVRRAREDSLAFRPRTPEVVP